MTNHTDQELMAALFVSDEGKIATHLGHAGEMQFHEEDIYRCSWEHCGAIPSCVRSIVWYRVSVHAPIAAGILRLIRERDEARAEIAQLESEISSWREWKSL